MPKTIPESKFTEWKGLDRISQIVHGMKCIWREICKDDTGIDGEIQVVVAKPDGPGFHTHGNIIKVQAKSGESYVKQDTPGTFSTPVTKDDLEMWAKSNYPVLFIVFHPQDDKLYCKEIREHVRSSKNIFQPPLKIVFTKATDEFNVDYFSTLKQQAEVSQPRITFQERERLFSNLLRVRLLPALSHASTNYTDSRDIIKQITGDFPPFCIVDQRLFTFGDLRSHASVLRRFCDRDIEGLSGNEWLRSDPERSFNYTFMLNLLLGKMTAALDLSYNRDFDRTYFPRENDTDLTFQKTWCNVRTGRNEPPRIVAKWYEYGLDRFWRHLACKLSFLRFGSNWFLRVVPMYFFTTDGVHPCESELVGPYTTKLKSMEHNMQVLNHVLFWAFTYSRGTESISFDIDGRKVIDIDKTPLPGIANFAIPDDPATYEEKPPSKQLMLFKMSDEELEAEDD